ncbi:hypothetical protein PUW91_00300 [Metamycoplasma hyosynoviae]|nr:hypothetical protein [Metamycoplasma hyosynoviae]MDD7894837.1 hypothetical protein [Metamycoplasma hyosynoviae]MDD7896546.1 hypothetical protein [Metamycoplasma hyosynoviae]
MHNERWLKNLFIKIDKKILEFIITWDESIVNYKYYTVGQLQVAINKIDEVIELLGPKLNKLKQACPPPVLKHWTYANDLYEFFTKEKSKLVDYRSSYISSRIKRFGGSLILRNNNDIVQPSYRILFESLDPRIIINPQDGSIIEIREGL